MSKIIDLNGKEYTFTGQKIYTKNGWQYSSFSFEHIINNWMENTIYNIGDVVKYNSQIWISTIKENSYKPGNEGWEVLK